MIGAWGGRPRQVAACVLFVFFASVCAAQAEKRVALIIGNSAYQNAAALRTAGADAKAMAAMFKNAGYDVNTAYDADVAQIRKAVRQFDDTAADADVAVVYFAGYGVAVNGVNYLAPVDARLTSDWDAEDELVTLDRFVAAVVQTRRLGVVILDASGENSLAQKMKKQRPHMMPGVSGSILVGNTNTLIAYATQEGSTIADIGNEHSAYTAALLGNLFVPGLDIRLALGRVRDDVLRITSNREEPNVYGALGGGVYALVPDKVDTTAPSAASANDGGRTDYRLIERINTKPAWEVFLQQHPTGCFADLARAHVAALEGGKDAPPSTTCDK